MCLQQYSYRHRNRPAASQLPSGNDPGFLGYLLYSLDRKHRTKESSNRVWCNVTQKEHDIDLGLSTAQHTTHGGLESGFPWWHSHWF